MRCALLLSLIASARAGPNFVLVMADDLRAEELGCYGSKLGLTPNIDRLATRGAVFEAAYAQGTTCAPSRRSMLWGRYPGSLTAQTTKQWPTLGAFLKSRSYSTFRVGKIFHMKVPGDIVNGRDGADDLRAWTQRFNSRGLEDTTPGAHECIADRARALLARNVVGPVVNKAQVRDKNNCGVFTAVRCDAQRLTEQADYKTATKAIEILDGQRRRKDGGPYFLAVGFVRPHYPYVSEQGGNFDWESRIEPRDPPRNESETVLNFGRSELKSTNLLPPTNNDRGDYRKAADFLERRTRGAYYDNVRFVDSQIGKVVEKVLDGSLEETMLILTSDHGIFLGEHGFWQKHNLHEQVAHVPLIIAVSARSELEQRMRGLLGGSRNKSPVALVDLYPTLTSLAGLGRPKHLAGVDLTRLLETGTDGPRQATLSFVYESSHQGLLVRSDGWAYLAYKGTKVEVYEEELYDMTVDPGQYNNLATTTSALGADRRCKSEQGRQLDCARALLCATLKRDAPFLLEPDGTWSKRCTDVYRSRR